MGTKRVSENCDSSSSGSLSLRTARRRLRPKLMPPLERLRTGTPRYSRLVTIAMSSAVSRATFCHCACRVASSFSRCVAL